MQGIYHTSAGIFPHPESDVTWGELLGEMSTRKPREKHLVGRKKITGEKREK
jgi:hypothetical protein